MPSIADEHTDKRAARQQGNAKDGHRESPLTNTGARHGLAGDGAARPLRRLLPLGIGMGFGGGLHMRRS
jgi:hypothetical protein